MSQIRDITVEIGKSRKFTTADRTAVEDARSNPPTRSVCVHSQDFPAPVLNRLPV